MNAKRWAIAVLAVMLAGGSGCFNVEVEEPEESRQERASWQDDGPREPGGNSVWVSSPAAAEGGGWRERVTQAAGQIFLGTEEGLLFYGYDALVAPEKEMELRARLQEADAFRAIEGVELAFRRGDEIVGTARTDEDGVAAVTWTPPEEGTYVFDVLVGSTEEARAPEQVLSALAEQEPASVVVAARPVDTPVVVIDLDHTLVDAAFWRVLLGSGRAMKGSVEVVRRIAEEYQVVYLTHRPDIMTQRSKSWLVEHGYPLAPMRVSTLSQAVGGSGEYKAAALAELAEDFERIEIGIGDKLSDAEAYVELGMTAYLIPHYDREDAEDVLEMAGAIEALARRVEEQEARLYVVDTWEQVEAGIFGGEEFGPQEYARRLQRQGQALAREQR